MVEVRYFAGAADAVGCSSEAFELPQGSNLAAVEAAVLARHGGSVADVLRVSAYLVGDELTRDPTTVIGDRVDVLPPFAGG